MFTFVAWLASKAPSHARSEVTSPLGSRHCWQQSASTSKHFAAFSGIFCEPGKHTPYANVHCVRELEHAHLLQVHFPKAKHCAASSLERRCQSPRLVALGGSGMYADRDKPHPQLTCCRCLNAPSRSGFIPRDSACPRLHSPMLRRTLSSNASATATLLRWHTMARRTAISAESGVAATHSHATSSVKPFGAQQAAASTVPTHVARGSQPCACVGFPLLSPPPP